LPGFEWVQNIYNLMSRGDETELFAVCRDHGLALTPYSPVAGGVLTGKYARDQIVPADSRLALRPDGAVLSPASFDAIDRLRERARDHGVSTGALALAWVMHHPLVAAATAGPSRSAEHLRLLREALTVSLDAATRDEMASWFTGH
jgi:aryl-alcohol dehydrogenase-like predicted oxidoreductase